MKNKSRGSKPLKAFGLGSYNIIMLTNSRTSHTTGNEQIQFTRALI